MGNIPEIKKINGISTLFVKDEPFLALAGEVHNSSSASLAYMEENVWPRLEGLYMNSLIVPVSWENIEPEEGVYCFELVDGLLRQASVRKMHLILCWFGLWKNAESSYVPRWVKEDIRRYFRAEKVTGEKLNTVSPLCQEAIDRDATAFARLMAHLRETDAEENIVVMVQVENEVGLLGTSRDYCPAAEEAFKTQVPQLLAGDGEAVAWREYFGEEAEESFMAYYFAKALERIAEAGRKEYPLPCFTNVWLRQHPWYPGSYPSGGPVRSKHHIWKKAAPSLFTIAPDIYVPYVVDVMEEYTQKDNPLVIPEIRKDAVAASYALYAYTGLYAICCSPFGVEELGMAPEAVPMLPPEMVEALKMDPLSFDLRGSREAFSSVYHIMKEIMPLYIKYRGTPHMRSYLKKNEHDLGSYHRFSEYNIEITYFPKMEACPAAAGVIFELTPDRFLILGMMSKFTISAKEESGKRAAYLHKETGTVVYGEWKRTQPHNGDELVMTVMGREVTCHMVEMYQY